MEAKEHEGNTLSANCNETSIRVYYTAKLLNLKQRRSKKACASSTPVRTPYSFRVADNGVGMINEIARQLKICAYLKDAI
ncbi:MAG: hypothetical protein ACXV2E_09320 [Halobacteriota archaeon]